MESSIDAISLNLDRLYMICENQNDERRCEQIQSLLDRKHKEFSKLLLQIKERKVHAQQSGLIIPMPLEMGSHMLMSSGLPISPRSSTFMDPIHQNAVSFHCDNVHQNAFVIIFMWLKLLFATGTRKDQIACRRTGLSARWVNVLSSNKYQCTTTSRLSIHDSISADSTESFSCA